MSESVCVCGLGVVGSAVFETFQDRKVNVLGYDKYKNGGIGNPGDMLDCDIVFLCLPTPYVSELKEYDKTSLHDVCSFLSTSNYDGVVVLKSTVEPGVSAGVADKYGLTVVHNPEFLTAKTAKQDFENQTHVVIGGVSKDAPEVLLVSEFYKRHWPEAEQSLCVREESEMMKLGVNCFYATKIQFFNELYALSQKVGAEYPRVMEMMLKNGWIAPHHTAVPGTDGQMSYGGMCFPKDTNALCQAMKKQGSPCKVLEAVIEERNEMRDD